MFAQRWNAPITVKALGVGALVLLMLIPLAYVQDLVGERRSYENEARLRIAERWGGVQTLSGPVLVVPVRRQQQTEKGWVALVEPHFILPVELRIDSTLNPDMRRYGIYSMPIYAADVEIHGEFSPATLASVGADDGGEPLWSQAVLRVPIADVGGIRSLEPLRLGDANLELRPGNQGIGSFTSIEVSWPLGAVAPDAASIPFSLTLRLAGSSAFNVLPFARHTDVRVHGAWADPGYVGAFLPERHSTDGKGFDARWQVLDLNRSYAQSGRLSELDGGRVQASAFGMSLYQPVGTYQRNERASKYGLLFIALTFLALFVFEALGRWRVHPVQYLFVGLGLCTFYVLLLALSEQIGFVLAYAIAASGVIGTIAGYAGAAAGDRSAGYLLGTMLGAVYGLLFGLVISEHYSLLMGALALFAALALLMFLTRKVDWYGLGLAPATGKMTP